MNKKLLIFLFIIAFAFAYTTYESMKLESKLSNGGSNIQISELPKNSTFKSFPEGKDLDIRKVASEGKLIFVHFWATWCAPCEIEFPELVRFINLMKERKDFYFFIVAVNDEEAKVKKFLSKFKFEHENTVLVTDSDNNYQNFGSYKLPETFLFNSDFKTLRKFEGQQVWTKSNLVNYFRTL